MSDLLYAFSIALGVVVGGAAAGGLVALVTGEFPLRTMAILAERLKLWGIVAALGGSFAMLKTIESGVLEGQPAAAGKQLLFVLTAYFGAHLGQVLMTLVAGEG